ncbi:MAG: heavy metal translocating P-type ATPase [Acholeplasmataceae bacterium]|jgi:Cu+-exporting ATPase|nr:heavy metal translocating P-type ATPase [Acholeplasmataceae bacterium]
MIRKTIKVSNITCAQCAKSIETHFDQLESIDAKVLVTSKKVVFNYDEEKYREDQIADQLRVIGYYPILNNEEQLKAKKRETIDLVIAAVLTFPLLWTMFVHLGINIYVPPILMDGYVQWAIATPILFYIGRHFFKATYHQIRGKNLGMDTLVVIGTSAAYIYSIIQTLNYSAHGSHSMPELYFETTAVIIFMVLLGNYFESRVKEKTSDALQALISLGAKEARVKQGSKESMIPIDQVKPGDIIIVLANEKVPLDGKIISGKSYIDEAMITGEPMPKFKDVGDTVIGSTMNIVETLEIKVTATGSDTILAHIIKTVEDTALIKPKAQRIADRIAQLFVPIVVTISILVLLAWLFIVDGGHELSHAFAPAIAVLVISCPCALGLATPTSISVGSGIAFKEGILYKGGEFFEIANKISAIAFDKTGTLTKGEPEMADFVGEKDTLRISASLEKHSNHPIAKAITNAYEEELHEVKDFEVLLGNGIKGTILNKTAYVGSINLIKELKLDVKKFDYERLLKQGKTVFFTVYDDVVVNMIAVEDPIKETANGVISELKRRGITPYMITGDQEITANYIAEKLGITHIFSEVLPHEKAEKVNAIQKEGHVVAFVGDGINDAPALKMADVGFAVGNGSDIAIDTSDVTLMSLDLGLVIKAIDLSLATLKNIYLNFFWAFAYNIVMIPLAAIGLLNPSLAGIGMGFSSIMVVLNALSLKLFKFKNIQTEE